VFTRIILIDATPSPVGDITYVPLAMTFLDIKIEVLDRFEDYPKEDDLFR